jgi:hypothetical protein
MKSFCPHSLCTLLHSQFTALNCTELVTIRFSTSTELLCAVVFPFSWLNSDLIPVTSCLYIDSARTQRKTGCIVEETCLPLGCLAIDVLLLSSIVCCGDMFTGPLPSNGSIRHNIKKMNSWYRHTFPAIYNRTSCLKRQHSCLVCGRWPVRIPTDTDYPDFGFSWFISVPSSYHRYNSSIGYYRLLPNPLQFTYRSTNQRCTV